MIYTDWTNEELREFLKTLQAARWSGARRVEFRERKVEYRTDAEMRRAEDDLLGLLNGRVRVGVTVASHSRGN